MSEEISLLEQAKKCLHIRDIYLRGSEVTIREDFEPALGGSVSVQLRVNVQGVQDVELPISQDGKMGAFTRIMIETAMRLVNPNAGESAVEGDKDSDENVLAKISAKFVALYQNDCSELSQEAKVEFAGKNALYHIWPYWREYVHNIATRAHLPVVMLPMYSLNSAPPASELVVTET